MLAWELLGVTGHGRRSATSAVHIRARARFGNCSEARFACAETGCRRNSVRQSRRASEKQCAATVSKSAWVHSNTTGGTERRARDAKSAMRLFVSFFMLETKVETPPLCVTSAKSEAKAYGKHSVDTPPKISVFVMGMPGSLKAFLL